MYSVADVKRAVADPKLILREVNRLYHTRSRILDANPGGINIFDQDWDVCLVLDACRYDYFEEYAVEQLDGTARRRESLASSTIEWVDTNIRPRTLHDTVYVTANPKFCYSSVDEDTFYDQVYTWEETESGDGRLESVDPELVATLTMDAVERYPNKRILAHFMQPHCPFLGATGRETFPERPWDDIRDNWPDVRDLTREAYAENVEYVLPYIDAIFDSVDGRVVVTADHGQLLGERVYPVPIREFAHPAGIYVPELVEVPWHVRESSERRRVVSEPPVAATDGEYDESSVERLLKQLGYRG